MHQTAFQYHAATHNSEVHPERQKQQSPMNPVTDITFKDNRDVPLSAAVRANLSLAHAAMLANA